MSFGIPVRNGVMLGLTASTALSTRGGFPVPALSLNFLSGTLDSRITFTRALNTATRVNSSGLIETVNANIPRFDYDSVTLQPRGLLIEEQRANLLLYSEQLNDATWGKVATVTANQLVSPDGATTADLVSTTANFQYVRQLITATANAAYTATYFVKPVTGSTTIRIMLTNGPQTEYAGSNFNLTGDGSLGTIFTTGTGVLTGRSITKLANGWYRCVVSGTNNTTSLYSLIDNHAGGTMSFGVWGAQLEAGAFATSYIPTVASTVTRNADVAQMTGTNFSSWYNQTQGTFVVAADSLGYSSNNMLLAVSDSGTTNLVQQFSVGSTTSRYLVRTAGADQAAMDATVSASAVYKIASAYAANDFATSANGGAVQTDTAGTVPTVTQMGIGSRLSSLVYNGHIRQIAYYNTRLSNTALQALSV